MTDSETCSTCRSPLVPGARFCGLCGQRVNTDPMVTLPTPSAHTEPQPVTSPTSEEARREVDQRGRRLPATGLVAIAAALLLCVVLVVGAILVTRGRSDPVPPLGVPTNTQRSDPSLTSSPSHSTTQDTPGPVDCWNGLSRPTAQDCSPIRGVAGLRWVFPSLSSRFSDCDPSSAYGDKVRAYGCTVTTASGRSARVVYSEWATFESGDRHYRAKYGTPNRRSSQFNVWSTTFVGTNFQTSRMFNRELPFSVTVASQDRDSPSAVMDGLDFRSAAETARYAD